MRMAGKKGDEEIGVVLSDRFMESGIDELN